MLVRTEVAKQAEQLQIGEGWHVGRRVLAPDDVYNESKPFAFGLSRHGCTKNDCQKTQHSGFTQAVQWGSTGAIQPARTILNCNRCAGSELK